MKGEVKGRHSWSLRNVKKKLHGSHSWELGGEEADEEEEEMKKY